MSLDIRKLVSTLKSRIYFEAHVENTKMDEVLKKEESNSAKASTVGVEFEHKILLKNPCFRFY